MRMSNHLRRRLLVATAMSVMLAGAAASAAAENPAGGTPPPAADREKVEQHLREIQEKVLQLQSEGKQEEAEHLKREAMALYSKLNPHAANAMPSGPEREQIHQQMQAIHDKMVKALETGNAEDVRRLRQEAEALQRKVTGQMYSGVDRPQAEGERAARMQHLRAAAEHLMAAGCGPEAEHVMRLIAQIQGEGRGEGRPRDDGQPSSDGRPGSRRAMPPGERAPNPGETSIAPAVRELRGEVEQMHRELRELREELEQAKSDLHK
jgi:hypothetical protein